MQRKKHSHFSQVTNSNELIEMLTKEIKFSIIKNIKVAKYYRVMRDCTPHISGEEQIMTLIICCVDIAPLLVKVLEFFLQFMKVNGTTGERARIWQWRVNIYIWRGKHISAEKATWINCRAFYTCCGCHSINLTLCQIANSCDLALLFFFGWLQRVYCLFSSSTKRWNVFIEWVGLHGITFKSLYDTLRKSHIESVATIRYQISGKNIYLLIQLS